VNLFISDDAISFSPIGEQAELAFGCADLDEITWRYFIARSRR